MSAEVLRSMPATAGAVVGVPEVVVGGATPEYVLATVRLSGSEGHAAQGSHAQARRRLPAVTVGVGVPQVAVGALPEHIHRAGCRRHGRHGCRAGCQVAAEFLGAVVPAG